MYKITSASKAGTTQAKIASFNRARKYYHDFCAFLGIANPTEVEDGTILAWSDNETARVTFEKLNSIGKA